MCVVKAKYLRHWNYADVNHGTDIRRERRVAGQSGDSGLGGPRVGEMLHAPPAWRFQELLKEEFLLQGLE